MMGDSIKRWTAKRRAELGVEIIEGKTTVAEACRAYDLPPSQIEGWVDDARRDMVDQSKPPTRHQLTGNSGLYYAAWHLSRRGWHVMPTVRNARGSDLIVTNDDESLYFGVQSKALSRRSPVPLGLSLESLRSVWWIITINANTQNPICFILRLDEVRALAFRSRNAGAYWLQPKAYDCQEFREAWHRLGGPPELQSAGL